MNRMTSAVLVSMSPSALSVSWIGIRVVTGGNIRGRRISRNRTVFALKSRKRNVIAARPASTTVPSPPSVDVTRLVQIGAASPLATKSRYRSNVGTKNSADRSIRIRSGLIDSMTR